MSDAGIPYRCAACGGWFIGVSESEAVSEAQELWGATADVANDPAYAKVCDDCFRRVTAIYPPEQFKADRARQN